MYDLGRNHPIWPVPDVPIWGLGSWGWGGVGWGEKVMLVQGGGGDHKSTKGAQDLAGAEYMLLRLEPALPSRGVELQAKSARPLSLVSLF